MAPILYLVALFLTLIAAGGYVVYIIKQMKSVFTWSYRILVAGFIVHTAFLVHQYYVLGTAPVLSLKAALAFFSWTIIGVYILFQLRFKLMVLGSFLTPLAAVLMIVSFSIPGAAQTTVKPIFKSIWLTVHVGTIFIGDALFAVAFMAGIMYLIQEYQIKSKKLGSFFNRLPSLQTLDSINHYALMYGFPFLTLGMVTGAIYAQYALGSYWRWDPKEVWSLITWLLYAALLHERLTVGWRGRRAAVMSIVCFLVLLFSFIGVSLWMSDYHSFQSIEGRTAL